MTDCVPSDRQPSLYCVYKFLDYDAHGTITIPSTSDPYFGDNTMYQVPMTANVDNYLKSQVWLADFLTSNVTLTPKSTKEFETPRQYLVLSSWQSFRWWFQPLRVYVCKNTDAADTACLGLAEIDLLPLTHDEAIEGTFKLRRVCVVLSWFVLSTERPKHFETVHEDSQRQKS